MTTFEEIIEGKKAVTAPQQGVVNARVAGGQVAPQPVTTQPVAQSKGDQANARVVGGQASAPAETTKVDNFDLANWLTMGLAGAAQKAQDEKDNVPQLSYQEQIEKLYGDTVDSPEERERKRKLQRNKAIIAAIGDGIGAIANMYYAGKSGINAFDPKTSISKAVREPYDKYLEEQKKYADRLRELRLKGYELDVRADAERRKEKKEAEIRKQNQDNIDRAYNADRADAAQKQDNWVAEFNADQETKAASQKLRETELAQKKAYDEAVLKLKAGERDEKIVKQAITKQLGKPFNIGEYTIYSSQWMKNWPALYEKMNEEMKTLKAAAATRGEKDAYTKFPTLAKSASPREKEQWVLENWGRLESGKEGIAELATWTPENLMRNYSPYSEKTTTTTTVSNPFDSQGETKKDTGTW